MRNFVYISWLNYLGGFDYWLFTGYTDDIIDVVDSGETKVNIFPGWPKSYGANADTITRQTFRKTRKQKLIRSQILTRNQAREMGEQIKSSPLVQIVTSRRDRRTVIVDNQSVTATKGSVKIHTLNLTISYTDDYPSQTI